MAVGHVDVLVGVPTLNNAGTIRPVVKAVHQAFSRYFPRDRSVLINSDGGSDDGTPSLVRNASADDTETVTVSHSLRTVHRISTPYHGVPGKGNALRQIMTAAELIAGACGGGAECRRDRDHTRRGRCADPARSRSAVRLRRAGVSASSSRGPARHATRAPVDARRVRLAGARSGRAGVRMLESIRDAIASNRTCGTPSSVASASISGSLRRRSRKDSDVVRRDSARTLPHQRERHSESCSRRSWTRPSPASSGTRRIGLAGMERSRCRWRARRQLSQSNRPSSTARG